MVTFIAGSGFWVPPEVIVQNPEPLESLPKTALIGNKALQPYLARNSRRREAHTAAHSAAISKVRYRPILDKCKLV
jgi:hypothetical protein